MSNSNGCSNLISNQLKIRKLKPTMQISDLILKSLCRRYYYDISRESIIIFAFRGSYPLQSLGSDPYKACIPEKIKTIVSKKINYKKAACTIGVWCPGSGDIALFPGSTVPSLIYMHKNPDTADHFNILCPGKYEYVRGTHPRNIEGYQRHEAFIMPGYGWIMRPQIIRKPGKSLFNFNEVQYNVILPGDNLHASRAEPYLPVAGKNDKKSLINRNFSSSGCLTIIGQPEQYVRNRHSNWWNSWEQFMQLVKSSSSDRNYSLILFNFCDLINSNNNRERIILRYGSQGSRVFELQQKLSKIYSAVTNSVYFTGKHDGIFQADTARAWLRFMKDHSPDSIKGEADLREFRSKTNHFIFTIKHYEHVIY
jgi:hypothetical protein